MSVEPLLERATRALRETTESSPAALERVLARLERPKPSAGVSMRHFRIAAWTLAASLLGVGAWANATGRVRWFQSEPESPSLSAPAAVPSAAPSASRVRKPRDVEPPPLPPESAAPALEAVAPPLAQPKAAPVAPARPARPAPSPAPDADALYRTAHEAHFVHADYAAAVAAWDRYLAAAEPGHRWTIEARYNRGIALYRLGHGALAREALEPFARGEYGGYRRADARRLLEALPHSD